MLKIDYRAADRRAQLLWDATDEQAPWLEIVRRLVFDHTDEAAQEDGYRISLPWWMFAALRNQFLQIFKGYGLGPGRSP